MAVDSVVRLEPFAMALLELLLKKTSYLSPCYVKKACLLGMIESKNAKNTGSSELARHHNIPSANCAPIY